MNEWKQIPASWPSVSFPDSHSSSRYPAKMKEIDRNNAGMLCLRKYCSTCALSLFKRNHFFWFTYALNRKWVSVWESGVVVIGWPRTRLSWVGCVSHALKGVRMWVLIHLTSASICFLKQKSIKKNEEKNKSKYWNWPACFFGLFMHYYILLHYY